MALRTILQYADIKRGNIAYLCYQSKYMKNSLYLFILLILPLSSYCARPTQHATNFVISYKECNSMTLSWTNGNGSARLIVARADAPTNWVPVDGSVYSVNTFGLGPGYGPNSDNYIIYNGGGTNFTKVTSLPPGHKYYFTIFEHDNNGVLTEYYTTGAPSASDSTYYVDLKYDIIYHDSCELKNGYTFVNRSSSNIPGVKYAIHFGDNDSSQLDSVTHSYSHMSGIIPSYITANTNMPGCKNTLYKSVHLYQKKLATIDWSFNHDTVQCLYDNFFSLKSKPIVNPLSSSYGYRWFTKSDTIVFSFFKKSFQEAGRYKLSLEITANISKGPNQYPTACKDTVIFYLNVLPSQMAYGNVDKDTQEIHFNHFTFTATDSTQYDLIWSFGDGDTSHRFHATHQYNDTGHYKVTLVTFGAQTCPGERTFDVYVYDSTLIADTSTTSVRNIFQNAPKVYPNPSGGIFTVEAENIDRIILFDLSGKRLEEIITNGEKMVVLDLQHLAKGLYMLKFEGNNHSSTAFVRIL